MNNFDSVISLSREINAFLEKFLDELPCDFEDPTSVCISCLLEILRGTAHTVTDLLARKIVKDAQILLRTQVERFIKIKKTCDDPDFSRDSINQTQRSRLKYMEFAIGNIGNKEEFKNNNFYQELSKRIDSDKLEELRKEVKQYPENPSIWQLAKETGLLQNLYSTAFRFYSEVVHCASTELDDCLHLEGDKPILVTYDSKNSSDIIPSILLSCHIVLESVSEVSQITKTDISSRYNQLREALLSDHAENKEATPLH